MELEAHWLARFGIQLDGAVASLFSKLDARQRGTEPHMKWPPITGLAQRGAEALARVPQKANRRHPGQQPAFPQDEV